MANLEPTAEDVKALDDVQLRMLVARTAAADLRDRGLAETGVTDGGDQRATDGGIDVRVEGDSLQAGGMFPRLPTGFQVKATRMRRADILKEMRPKGRLRPSIISLAEAGGAYVIAAGRDDLSDEGREVVRAVMREALGDEASLPVDFYDAGRLARWAAQFRGVAGWLLAAVGRPMRGWSSVSAWSTPGDAATPYLIDATARMSQGGEFPEPMTVLEGIAVLRSGLGSPRQVSRLVGLSGMGKTRLAEALFDPSIGDNALSAGWAVYGDAGAAPEVSPASMARQLVDQGRQAVLIVDNCPAALHRVLTGVVREASSAVSLLTIDFDVGPDRPEHTAVYRIDPAADALVDALLVQRSPHLSAQDRDRIADFCHGNTRIALVLARAAKTSGGLTGLSDPELLDRLFLNARRGLDADLRAVAGAASLVYAFEVEPSSGRSEVDWLAEFAGVRPMTFHRKVGDLLERGMAQQRGVQRAILPPAIAGWLAQETIERYPTSVVIDHMVTRAPERLAGSFVRRLALLDPAPQVKAIAEVLLANGGRYGTPTDVLGGDMGVVKDIAHLAPAEALEVARRTIERLTPEVASARRNLGRNNLLDLLGGLAHEASYFAPATTLLADLACAERDKGSDPVQPRVLQLFQMSHAGTEALSNQRLALLDDWLGSPDPLLAALGLKALEAGLTFNPRHFFPQERDGGIRPSKGSSFTTVEEMVSWIRACLERLVVLASHETGEEARVVFLRRFDALARREFSHDLALKTFEAISGAVALPGGWFAVCRALSKAEVDRRTPQLLALEVRLRPTTLEQRFDTWLYENWHRWKDPRGQIEDGWDHCRAEAERVGFDAVGDPAWSILAQRALSDSKAQGFHFGVGVARAYPNKTEGWRTLLAVTEIQPETVIHWPTLGGYINETRMTESALVEGWIDELLAEPRTLESGFLLVASGRQHQDKDLRRILAALRASHSCVLLDHVWWSLPHEDASDHLVAEVADILIDEGRYRDAVRFLDTRLQSPVDRPWGEPLVRAGLRLVETMHEDDEDDEDVRDYGLARLLTRCLVGPDAEQTARVIVDRLRRRALESDAWLHGMPDTMAVLCSRFPDAVLDGFLLPPADGSERYRIDHFFRSVSIANDDDDDTNLNGASLAAVVAWTAVEPQVRAPLAVRVVPIINRDAAGDPRWAPIILALLDLCDSEDILDVLHFRMSSSSGTGSAADRYRSRRPMFEGLATHDSARVRQWSVEMTKALDQWVGQMEAHERARDQRFE